MPVWICGDCIHAPSLGRSQRGPHLTDRCGRRPFLVQGPVESFDSAVGLRPVRAGAVVLDVWSVGVLEKV